MQQQVSDIFLRLLSWFVPDNLRDETALFARSCTLVAVCWLFTACCAVLWLLVPCDAWLLGLLVALIPFLQKHASSFRVPSMLFVGQQYLVSVMLVKQLGDGLNVFCTPAASAPMIAMLLLGQRAGLLSALLSVLLASPLRHVLMLVPSTQLATNVANCSLYGGMQVLLTSLCVGLLYSWLYQQELARLQSMYALNKQFFAVVCHELRGPCQAIVNGAQLLVESGKLDADLQMIAEAVDMSGSTLVALVSDVLDYEKIAQGLLELEPAEVQLQQLAESVVEMASLQQHDQQVELICDVDDQLPHTLLLDPVRLRQVFMNLIGNALKFTEKGAVTVQVRLQQRTETHAMIKVVIADTGIGIPVSKLAQLFTPFVTVVRESSKRKPGTGLGLSICKRLLNLMGGSISVHSEENKGSTFVFQFVAGLVPCPSTPVIIADRSPLYGLKLLIVDANPYVRATIRQHAMRWGMKCEECASAEDLQAHLFSTIDDGVENLFDVILTAPELVGKRSVLMLSTERARLRFFGDSDPRQLRVVHMWKDAHTFGAHGHGKRVVEVHGDLVKPLTTHKLEAVLLQAVTGIRPREESQQQLHVNLLEHPHASITKMSISARSLSPLSRRPSTVSRTSNGSQRYITSSVTELTHDSSNSGEHGSVLLRPGVTERRMLFSSAPSGGGAGSGPPRPPRHVARRGSQPTLVSPPEHGSAVRRHSLPTPIRTSPNRGPSPVDLRPLARTATGTHSPIEIRLRHLSAFSHSSTQSPSSLPESVRRSIFSMKESPAICISSPESRASSDYTASDVRTSSMDVPRLSIDAASPPTALARRSLTPPFIAHVQVATPVEPLPMRARAVTSPGALGSAPPPLPLHNVRVAVVDDMPLTSKITAAMLKKAGAIIAGQGCTGSEAIELAGSSGIDVIILDLHLPDMDGFDVARRIRAAEAARLTGSLLLPTAVSTPRRSTSSMQSPLSPSLSAGVPTVTSRVWLVALTGDSGLTQACLDAGIDAYLVKPARQEQLIQAIRRSFPRPRSASPDAQRLFVS